MPKKKVLIFTDWYYPGFMAGGPVQSAYNLMSHLKEYYDFSVVTRDTDYTSNIPYKDIKSDEWNILPNGMRIYYFSAKKLSYSNMNKFIENEDFDIAYLNSMYSPRFTIMPLLILKKMTKKIIVAPRGMLAPSAIAIKSWKKRPFLLWLKNSSMIKRIRLHAASEQEAGHARDVFGYKVEIRVAPNLPAEMKLPEISVKKKEVGFVHFINVARVSPEKNLLFALQVLQQIRGRVKFEFYGPVYDTSYWETCKGQLAKLPENIVAKYMGPIERDNIPHAMQDAHFLFMPTRGENFGHTILEAMICGCPPIISDQTPWKGLEPLKAGFDISLEKPERFVEVIEETINMNQEEFDLWSEGTRKFVSEFIANPGLIEQSREVFEFIT